MSAMIRADAQGTSGGGRRPACVNPEAASAVRSCCSRQAPQRTKGLAEGCPGHTEGPGRPLHRLSLPSFFL